MSPMDRLAALDADTRDWAVDMALEIALGQQPIEGLRPQAAAMIRAIRSARGQVVPYDVLADAMAKDRANPPESKAVTVQLHRIKRARPDLRGMIDVVWGVGLRWTGPSDPPTPGAEALQ